MIVIPEDKYRRVLAITILAFLLGITAYATAQQASIGLFSFNLSGQPELFNYTTLICLGNVTCIQDSINHTISINASGVSFDNNHANLTNLEWSKSGHIIDTNLDMNFYPIYNISEIKPYTSGEFGLYELFDPTFISFIDHQLALDTNVFQIEPTLVSSFKDLDMNGHNILNSPSLNDNDSQYLNKSDPISHKQTTKNSNYNISISDETIFVNVSISNFNLTLPTAINNTNIYNIKSTTIINSGGVNTVGSSSSNSAAQGTIHATKIIPTTTGYIYLLSMNVQTSAGNGNMALYTDNSGNPNTLIVNSTSKALVSGWNNFTISNTLVNSGQSYWIAFQTDNGASKNYYVASGNSRCYATLSYQAFPATYPASTCDSVGWNHAIYFVNNPIIINTTSNQLIDNSLTYSLKSFEHISLQSDNSNWWII